ncbi:MAG: hypothetical protein LBH72_03145 [Proteiniphilum sp.]|nr:hypothetical protein [Proteiniphilum sp.]
MRRRSFKHSLFPIAAAALLVTAVSCIEVGEAPNLSVAPETLNLENVAGSGTITVTCSAGWVAESNVAWLTLSPKSGTGNGEVIVTATENAAMEAREAKITFTAGSAEKGIIGVTGGITDKTVTVRQAGAAPKLDKSVEFTFTGNVITFYATAKSITVDWEDGSALGEYDNLYDTGVTHTYASNAEHTVRIQAEKLSLFNCGGKFPTAGSITALDVSNCTALTELHCSYNQLSALDVSKNTTLKVLRCTDNRLSTLDVSECTALTYLNCGHNQLSALDVSKNTTLTWLDCHSNRLSTLDVSKNTKLEVLGCSYNPLSALDVSNNTALTLLACGGNELSALDVSKNTALTFLDCGDNPLSALDVSKNTKLTWLDCFENQLSADALNRIFTDLPDLSGMEAGLIRLWSNPGTGTCDLSIAADKNWTVGESDW